MAARSRRPRSGAAGIAASARRAIARTLTGLVAIAIVASIAGVAWLLVVYPSRSASGLGHEVSVVVRPGMSLDTLAEELALAHAIDDPRVFVVYARLMGAAARLRDGEVRLTDDMEPRDVLRSVAIGLGNATVWVTIPEGFDRFDIAERLAHFGVCERSAFVAATEDTVLLGELGVSARTAEGYLFPDTYRLARDLAAEEVVRRLVENFRRRVDPLYETNASALAVLERDLHWQRPQVLVLASIVEKEAQMPEERPIIAGVFLNRLLSATFRPRRLQADPTVSYGCRALPNLAPSCARFDGRHITRAMLADRANPYNTYRHEDLPPGPICNPGLASIGAVLRAESHDYFYFVARGRGRHTFSATLDDHNQAVETFSAEEESRAP